MERVQCRGGEPVQGAVVPLSVDGLKLRSGEVSIAWLPNVAPSTRLTRFVKGADLAVVTVGRAPWPRSEARVRLSLVDAIAISSHARNSWILTDEGRWAERGEA